MEEVTNYTVLFHPSDPLRQEASEITQIDDEVISIARRMLLTMYANQGIGLAGNQVGITRRIITIDVSEEHDQPLLLANPVILNSSKETQVHEEGCLSIPEMRADVTRSATVTIKAIDIEKNAEVTFDADELLAICVQHEIDHLNGVLFIDHLSRLKRFRLLREYVKDRLVKDTT